MRTPHITAHLMIVVLSFFCFAAPVDSTQNSQATVKTVTAGKFFMSYKITGDTLSGMVSYPAGGWIAVGFGAKSVMKGARIIIGTVSDGKSVVLEEYGTGMFSHKPINAMGGKGTLVSGECTSKNNSTTLSFSIVLNNNGNKFASLAPKQNLKIIFARGDGSDLTKKHKDAGTAKVVL